MVLFPCFRLQERMQKATLGEWGWNRLLKRKHRREMIQEYMRAHHGQRPPMSKIEKLKQKICCCFYPPDDIDDSMFTGVLIYGGCCCWLAE